MKKILVILLLTSPALKAQEYVRLMNDPTVNFYTVQDEFNKYTEARERKENNWFNRLFSWSKPDEKEAPGFEIYKRWEYFNQDRVYPSGNRIQPDAMWNEYKKYVKRNPQISIQTSGNWTPIGPTSWISTGWNPGLGRINAVAVDPVNPNIIYAGAPAGGIWKSIDDGATWQQPTTDLLPSIGVSSIVIDYINPSIIYIGTGDADASDSYSIGVLKSTDGGLTWAQTGLTWSIAQVRSICKLIMDPVNNNILFAATKDGIYKTINAGNSWTQVKSGSFRDIEFKPTNSQVIYAAGTSFFRSVDGGNTFNAITAGLPSSATVNRLAIAVSPADSNYVYVAGGKASDSGFQGLYKSIDGGATFIVKSTTPNLYGYQKNGSDAGGQSSYTMTLCVSPVDPEKIFTGGVNIWSSDNGGTSWQIVTHWYYPVSPQAYVHADQHFMEYFDFNMYVGCDGGIFKSEDDAVSWSDKSAGMAIMQFYRIGGSSSNPAVFIGGSQDNGCSFKNNNIWKHFIGADGMEATIDPTNTQHIYGEIYYGQIYSSMNGGNSVSVISNGVSESGAWVTPFMLDPNDNTTLFAGYVNVWRGDNYGTVWSQASNFTGGATISALTIAKANSNYMYIIRGPSVLKSDDAGNNWTNISAGLPSALTQPTYIAVDPTDAGRIWVTLSGYVAGKKVYFSNDTGQTWINESYGLPNIPVNCIAYQDGAPDGLYIGTDMGIFYKDDSLSSWQPFWNGLPNVPVTEIELNFISNQVRAGTYGRGAWESDFYAITAPPQAAFTSNHQQMCPGDSVIFTDQSLDAAPGWQWIFQGGNPATSNLRDPVVYYNGIGDFDVTLIVYNSFGVDSTISTSYIHVDNPSTASLPLVEDFESGTFPPSGWSIIDPDGVITWEETTAGGFGNSAHSTSVHNFGNSLNGKKDWLFTPQIDLSQLANPYLKFDVAYARLPNRPDSLAVFYTSDCGVTKNYIYKKTGLALATGGIIVSNFIPTALQWRTDSVLLPSSAGNVQIGFENTNGYGNNLYIDNVNIYNSVVGINELGNNYEVIVAPNPATDHVKFNVKGAGTKNGQLFIEIYNCNSQQIAVEQKLNDGDTDISLEKVTPGLYIYHLVTNDGLVVKAGKIIHL